MGHVASGVVARLRLEGVVSDAAYGLINNAPVCPHDRNYSVHTGGSLVRRIMVCTNNWRVGDVNTRDDKSGSTDRKRVEALDMCHR